jgi:hypothetical protein
VVIPAPGLYIGSIRHRRFVPRAHQFRYGLFMALLDVDRLRETMAVSRLTGYNRWNWASFDDRDHVGDPRLGLRDRLTDQAARAGEQLPDGPIYLLTHLRCAGYVFRPDLDSIVDTRARCGWCPTSGTHAAVGAVTGGVRPIRSIAVPGRRPQSLRLSVMDYDMDYEFVLTPPGDSLRCT